VESILSAAVTAVWLGILTSISPCPLATNIAAVSFVGRRLESTGKALWSGAAYVIGRLLAYVVLAVIVTIGLLSIPGVSNFLQKYMNYLLGPILIVVGVILLGVLPFAIPGFSPSAKMQERASQGNAWGASLLGALFALSFCPVSAALFFGSLIPLAVRHNSYILLPSLYGIGTGLPVLAFGVVIALSAQSVAKLFKRVTQFELWFRRITGVVFMLVGVYYCLIYFAGLDI
jgi:cytochrome c-type biogenesis protein